MFLFSFQAKRLHDVFREPFLVSKKQRAADTGKWPTRKQQILIVKLYQLMN